MDRYALISVHDKTGIVPLAQALASLGCRILSLGSTADVLREGGVAVEEVSAFTGADLPKAWGDNCRMVDPRLRAGILARRNNPDDMRWLEEHGAPLVDYVIVNYRPFEDIVATGAPLVEACSMIDVGGPPVVRAAARNWQFVSAITDPADYADILEELERDGELSNKTRLALSAKAFRGTAAYNAVVAEHMSSQGYAERWPDDLTLTYRKVRDLRHGENSHQTAAIYRDALPGTVGISQAEQLGGKEMSYNNVLDAAACLEATQSFRQDRPFVICVKHTGPIGAAYGQTQLDAYNRTYGGDPLSLYAGLVGFNTVVEADTAQKVFDTSLEIVLAPDYTEEALAILLEKKSLRVLRLPGMMRQHHRRELEAKRVTGGMLVQDSDWDRQDMRISFPTNLRPTEEQMRDLRFAWRLVRHVKSNGLVLARNETSVGIGQGQPNALWAMELAIGRAGDRTHGSCMASDGSLPFANCVELAAEHGIAAIVQPGGGPTDHQIIDACNEKGIAMIFTGMRHFCH